MKLIAIDDNGIIEITTDNQCINTKSCAKCMKRVHTSTTLNGICFKCHLTDDTITDLFDWRYEYPGYWEKSYKDCVVHCGSEHCVQIYTIKAHAEIYCLKENIEFRDFEEMIQKSAFKDKLDIDEVRLIIRVIAFQEKGYSSENWQADYGSMFKPEGVIFSHRDFPGNYFGFDAEDVVGCQDVNEKGKVQDDWVELCNIVLTYLGKVIN